LDGRGKHNTDEFKQLLSAQTAALTQGQPDEGEQNDEHKAPDKFLQRGKTRR